MGDRQEVLLVNLQVLHDKNTVAHESIFVATGQDQVLAEHFVSDFLHLINRIAHVDARLEAILSKDALRAREALHLRLDYELPFEVGAEFSPDNEGLLGSEGHSAQRNRNHVLMNELGGLVLVQHQIAPWQGEKQRTWRPCEGC